MTPFSSLWLPIVLSAVAVFVVSSLIHMLSPWHKGDYQRLPDEDGVLKALQPFAIPPGDYLAPRPNGMADMKTPEFVAKRTRGPVLVMTVMPSGAPDMTGPLIGWFIYLLVISAAAGCVACMVVPPGGDDHRIFHFAAFTAAMGYVAALWQMSIWYRRSLRTTITSSIDGVIYAVITGLIFVWMWPRM